MEELANRGLHAAEPVQDVQAERLPQPSVWIVLRDAALAWIDHRNIGTAAALAYYAAFSLAPVLVIAVTLSGVFYGRASVEGHVVAQFQDLLGSSGAELLQKMIQASYLSPKSWQAGLIGFVGILVGATALFGELSAAFGRIFGTQRTYRYAWLSAVMERLKGLTLVVGIGFLLVASLLASAGLVAVGEWVARWSRAEAVLLSLLQAGVSLLMLSLLFGMMLRLMAPVKLKPLTVAAGALTTSVLFELGKWALGLYLGQGVVGSVFGAAGTLAVLLVWLNYVSMVILFGVEITYQLYRYQDKLVHGH
ncbi:MAG TPA: YihY/virulence factor BrkB family protein [Candidatus Aquabacterium excrementipullorum]|nr:YihY/virulence factor BrkB family protein [Candidatus Aquabacterium excrementipullorum]